MKHRSFLLLLPVIALLSVGFCSSGKAQMTLEKLRAGSPWTSCAAPDDEGYDFDIVKMKAELDYGRDKKFTFDGNTVTIGKRKLQVVGDTLVDGKEVFLAVDPHEHPEKCPANGYVRPPKGNGFADFVNAVGTGMQIGMQQAPPSAAASSQTTLAQQQANIQATAARDAALRQQQAQQAAAKQNTQVAASTTTAAVPFRFDPAPFYAHNGPTGSSGTAPQPKPNPGPAAPATGPTVDILCPASGFVPNVMYHPQGAIDVAEGVPCKPGAVLYINGVAQYKMPDGSAPPASGSSTAINPLASNGNAMGCIVVTNQNGTEVIQNNCPTQIQYYWVADSQPNTEYNNYIPAGGSDSFQPGGKFQLYACQQGYLVEGPDGKTIHQEVSTFTCVPAP